LLGANFGAAGLAAQIDRFALIAWFEATVLSEA
jgi:hypothetical protein